VDEFFEDLASDDSFLMLPVTDEIALEVPHLLPLRDPADRVIAATAFVWLHPISDSSSRDWCRSSTE